MDSNRLTISAWKGW